jgi:hypothetical protein
LTATLIWFAVRRFVSANWRWLVPVIAAAAIVGAGWWALSASYSRGYERGYAAAEKRQETVYRAALAKALALQKAIDKAAYDRGIAEAQAQQKIEYRTRTLIREVPKYVTREADAAAVIPWGFVRVFDAAASGSDPAAIAYGPAQSDDAASDVKLSEIAAMFAENAGACHANAEQLTQLQAVVRDFQARVSAPP